MDPGALPDGAPPAPPPAPPMGSFPTKEQAQRDGATLPVPASPVAPPCAAPGCKRHVAGWHVLGATSRHFLQTAEEAAVHRTVATDTHTRVASAAIAAMDAQAKAQPDIEILFNVGPHSVQHGWGGGGGTISGTPFFTKGTGWGTGIPQTTFNFHLYYCTICTTTYYFAG